MFSPDGNTTFHQEIHPDLTKVALFSETFNGKNKNVYMYMHRPNVIFAFQNSKHILNGLQDICSINIVKISLTLAC